MEGPSEELSGIARSGDLVTRGPRNAGRIHGIQILIRAARLARSYQSSIGLPAYGFPHLGKIQLVVAAKICFRRIKVIERFLSALSVG